LIIQPTSYAALAWAGAASGAGLESWRIGSVLAARPLGTTPAGTVVLQIGALTVEADASGTGSSLPAQFQVRVLSLGAQPLLEVVGGAAPPAAQAVGRALRQRLPRQNGYAPLLATFAALAKRAVARQLPAHLRMALARFEQSIRTPAELADPDGLQHAVERSGLFLEADLLDPARADDAFDDDWKAALLRLAAALQGQPAAVSTPSPHTAETPPPLFHRGLQAQARATPGGETPTAAEAPDRLLPQLRDAAHAALARLEVTQLEAGTLPAWMIEIPVQGRQGYDVLQLRIEAGLPDAPSPGDGDWTLGFAIDLPSLGPVHGELQLRGLRLGVRLWAVHAASVDRLERRFAALSRRLAACGLVLDGWNCQHGLPLPAAPRGAGLLTATA